MTRWEYTSKISDARVDWSSEKTIVQAIPVELENFVRNLVDDDESYRLTNCSVKTIDPDNVVVDCVIERLDWTKDAFSSTTHHNASFSVCRDTSSNIVTYRTETTVPETKDLMVKLQKSLHAHFRQEGVVANDASIQRILANHFFDNKARYEFLYVFIDQDYDGITFRGIVDIDAGVDHNLPDFPEKFSWLKGNVDEIELHGKGIHLTEILKLGEIGGLIFGEIYAEFKFEYSDAKGTCVIGYGFPRYYGGKSSVEFEVKIAKLSLYADYVHVSKRRVERYLLQQFQKNKHLIFDEFVKKKKSDPRKRTTENQYYLFSDDEFE